MIKYFQYSCILFSVLHFQSCAQKNNLEQGVTFQEMNSKQQLMTTNQKDTATFAAGCFWCVEGQFQQLNGVEDVISGFIGGHTKNPTYEEVCTGSTGHAEACNIVYDPNVISYDELLAAFFVAHDPTQLNRQGNDVGTQYRSAIFFHNTEQKEKAEYYIQALNKEGAYGNPIVTEIKPYQDFYKAEDYHKDYYLNNPNKGYCQMVVKPKVEKFKKVFADKIK